MGAINEKWFDALNGSVEFTVDCPGLQRIATQAQNSVNATIAAANSQLVLVTADYNALALSINALNAQIATMTGVQAANTALSTVSATASGVVDLSSAIAYIHAQGSVLITLGDTSLLTFVKQALTLAQDVVNVTTAYNRLANQIASLEAMITELPARLATLLSNIEAQAATIPNCIIV